MPTPRKKLLDLLRDRTFLARRHENLMSTEIIPAKRWPELHQLQTQWRVETSNLERRAIALQIQRLLRETPAERMDRILDEMPIPSLEELRIPNLEELTIPGLDDLARILKAPPEPL